MALCVRSAAISVRTRCRIGRPVRCWTDPDHPRPCSTFTTDQPPQLICRQTSQFEKFQDRPMDVATVHLMMHHVKKERWAEVVLILEMISRERAVNAIWPTGAQARHLGSNPVQLEEQIRRHGCVGGQ